MSSSKQRRAEIQAARAARAARAEAIARIPVRPADAVDVNPALLAPSHSYVPPDFVTRGYYLDVPFRCVDCGADEVWTATQQKWWFEIAKGFEFAKARRCRPCRRRERERRAAARKAHLEGLARKALGLPKPGRR